MSMQFKYLPPQKPINSRNLNCNPNLADALILIHQSSMEEQNALRSFIPYRLKLYFSPSPNKFALITERRQLPLRLIVSLIFCTWLSTLSQFSYCILQTQISGSIPYSIPVFLASFLFFFWRLMFGCVFCDLQPWELLSHYRNAFYLRDATPQCLSVFLVTVPQEMIVCTVAMDSSRQILAST